MKKHVLFLFAFLITVISFAQNAKEFVHNEDTGLIEATYYHDNGEISQIGTFTTDGKLHGEWISFNQNGDKLVEATYKDGKKVGKWLYWIEDTLKEVQYDNNNIVDVNLVALQ